MSVVHSRLIVPVVSASERRTLLAQLGQSPALVAVGPGSNPGEGITLAELAKRR